jgi:hypothetical protein
MQSAALSLCMRERSVKKYLRSFDIVMQSYWYRLADLLPGRFFAMVYQPIEVERPDDLLNGTVRKR